MIRYIRECLEAKSLKGTEVERYILSCVKDKELVKEYNDNSIHLLSLYSKGEVSEECRLLKVFVYRVCERIQYTRYWEREYGKILFGIRLHTPEYLYSVVKRDLKYLRRHCVDI